MTLAILCSGQGRQHPEMFTLTGEVSEAAGLFAHATGLLGGRDPREMVRQDCSEEFHRNRPGQILCTLQAVSAAAALGPSIPHRLIVAGYSIGEVAAWGVAGMFPLTDTLDIAARRAEIMDAYSHPDDGLLFIRGLSRANIEALCARYGAGIAIINPGDAFVLGGNRTALGALSNEAKATAGTRVVDIPVDVASHTDALTLASPAFRDVLSHSTVAAAPAGDVRLLSGIDGTAVINLEAGLDKLALQISHTVHWASCLQGCIEGGATAFLELGPGGALSEMARGAYPDVSSRSLEDFRSVQGVRSWIEQQI